MKTLRLAVPTNNPGGMEAGRSDHFGHSDLFTIINLKNGEIAAIETVGNVAHGAGGCMVPVQHLKDQNVDALVVGGMGMRPLIGFNEVGIDVYYAHREEYVDVQAVVDGFLQDKLPVMQQSNACKGGADCHH